MKKVLTTVLILEIAQIASAGYFYWSVEADNVGQGAFSCALKYSSDAFDGNNHLGVWAQEFNYAQFDHFGLGNPNGGNSNGLFIDSDNASAVFGTSGQATWHPGATVVGAFYPNGSGAAGNHYATWASPVTVSDGLALVSFAYQGALGDVITFNVRSANLINPAWVTGTQSFEVVPEPMTLALLGFGSLLIRRRKAL